MDSIELKRRFGKRVQALREGKGLTQEQLAARIDRSVATVSNIERGVNATRIEVAHQMAVELDVTLSDLFAFSPAANTLPEREPISFLVSLVTGYDDETIRQLTEVVRAVLVLHR